MNNKNSRVYMNQEAFGRLLGYVGSITAEELEKNKEKGYSTSSLIGKAGLEQVYEDKLRGVDGVEIYIEREEEKVEIIAKEEPQHGEDVQLTIDSELQANIYEEMNGAKGSAALLIQRLERFLLL